jgi:hypothetical protein
MMFLDTQIVPYSSSSDNLCCFVSFRLSKNKSVLDDRAKSRKVMEDERSPATNVFRTVGIIDIYKCLCFYTDSTSCIWRLRGISH